MKYTYLLILIVFFVQCKQSNQKKIDAENQKRYEEWSAKEGEKRKKEIEKRKEELKRIEYQQAKLDSFIAQFDTLYQFVDSTVVVKGIIQSSGLRGTESFGIKAEFQLTNPKKRFFLLTDKDLSSFWGKCVSVTGKYVKGWNFESGNSRENFAYGMTAIHLETVELISNNYCFNSPVFKPASENSYKKHKNDSVYFGQIIRIKRPAPDIYYDYGFVLDNPISLDEEGWQDVKTLPILLNIPLDTLNFIIENKKKVKIYGDIVGGYAEGIVFDCKEFQGYE